MDFCTSYLFLRLMLLPLLPLPSRAFLRLLLLLPSLDVALRPIFNLPLGGRLAGLHAHSRAVPFTGLAYLSLSIFPRCIPLPARIRIPVSVNLRGRDLVSVGWGISISHSLYTTP